MTVPEVPELEELLAQVTEENLHAEAWPGEPVGLERWWVAQGEVCHPRVEEVARATRGGRGRP